MARSLNPGTRGEVQRERAELGNAQREALREDAPRREKYHTPTVRRVLDNPPAFKPPRELVKKMEQEMKKDKRPHCKTRPNRASKGGGGGSKPFVPWC